MGDFNTCPVEPILPQALAYFSLNMCITLPTKVCLVKAMVFLVVMYGCESWTIKKAECRRIDTFELWCWRRLLRVPWTARRSNQSILKEISPEYSLERWMLKLKLQILWPPDAKNWLMWKDLDAGKDWGQEEKGTTEDEMVGWHHWLHGHEFEQALGVGDGQGGLACCSPRVAKSQTQLIERKETNSPDLHNKGRERRRRGFVDWIYLVLGLSEIYINKPSW